MRKQLDPFGKLVASIYRQSAEMFRIAVEVDKLDRKTATVYDLEAIVARHGMETELRLVKSQPEAKPAKKSVPSGKKRRRKRG